MLSTEESSVAKGNGAGWVKLKKKEGGPQRSYDYDINFFFLFFWLLLIYLVMFCSEIS